MKNNVRKLTLIILFSVIYFIAKSQNLPFASISKNSVVSLLQDNIVNNLIKNNAAFKKCYFASPSFCNAANGGFDVKFLIIISGTVPNWANTNLNTLTICNDNLDDVKNQIITSSFSSNFVILQAEATYANFQLKVTIVNSLYKDFTNASILQTYLQSVNNQIYKTDLSIFKLSVPNYNSIDLSKLNLISVDQGIFLVPSGVSASIIQNFQTVNTWAFARMDNLGVKSFTTYIPMAFVNANIANIKTDITSISNVVIHISHPSFTNPNDGTNTTIFQANVDGGTFNNNTLLDKYQIKCIINNADFTLNNIVIVPIPPLASATEPNILRLLLPNYVQQIKGYFIPLLTSQVNFNLQTSGTPNGIKLSTKFAQIQSNYIILVNTLITN